MDDGHQKSSQESPRDPFAALQCAYIRSSDLFRPGCGPAPAQDQAAGQSSATEPAVLLTQPNSATTGLFDGGSRFATQSAQQPPEPRQTGLKALAFETLSDFKAFPRRRSTWVILGIGAGAAAAAYPADDEVNAHLMGSDAADRFFAPGPVDRKRLCAGRDRRRPWLAVSVWKSVPANDVGRAAPRWRIRTRALVSKRRAAGRHAASIERNRAF